MAVEGQQLANTDGPLLFLTAGRRVAAVKYLFFLSFKCDGLRDQQGSTSPSEDVFLCIFFFSLFFWGEGGCVRGGRSGGAALRLPVLSRHAGSSHEGLLPSDLSLRLWQLFTLAGAEPRLRVTNCRSLGYANILQRRLIISEVSRNYAGGGGNVFFVDSFHHQGCIFFTLWSHQLSRHSAYHGRKLLFPTRIIPTNVSVCPRACMYAFIL